MSPKGVEGTKIKICGIQQAADALIAAEAGADFVGLVFVPARRRRVDEDSALRIISSLREYIQAPPKVVGLFANQPLEEVDHIVEICHLDMVQLCGDEPLEYCGQMTAPVIKVVHVPDDIAVDRAVPEIAQVVASLRERGHLVTLDSKVEGLQGGTGRSFNWDVARALSMMRLPFLLAGGLTPANVGDAVSMVRPWGVDVSGGVETEGVKDGEKIRAFIHATRAVPPTGAMPV